MKQKVAQNIAISFGYFFFAKDHTELPKVSKLAKITQSGHPNQVQRACNSYFEEIHATLQL
jgi:hypothetical protein